jgi:hypothetical protein
MPAIKISRIKEIKEVIKIIDERIELSSAKYEAISGSIGMYCKGRADEAKEIRNLLIKKLGLKDEKCNK